MATNTPEPTPTPIYTPTAAPSWTPMPTWVWPTPTPYVVTGDVPEINMPTFDIHVGAEHAVNFWQSGNQGGALDAVQGVMIMIVLLATIRHIIRQWREL